MDNLEQTEIGEVGNTLVNFPLVKKKREVQSNHWCFTVNNPDEDQNLEQRSKLFSLSKQWVFQLEEGDEGTPHWQMYVNLTKKMRFAQLKKMLPTWHIEKCNNIKASIEYCQKSDGRLDGPWTSGIRAPVRDPLVGKELYPFQQEIMNIIAEDPVDDRIIHWFWDEKGCKGKTTLAKHIALTRPKEMLYLSGSAKDMKYAVTSFQTDQANDIKIVIFGFPRSMEEFVSYGGIEEIKDGLFFSSKYESSMCVFNAPHIICLANFEPERGKMSLDKWAITEIED